MKNRSTRVTVIIVILILAMVGYYTYLSNRARENKDDSRNLTAVEKALGRDLTNDYPPTPKEVMKYYNELVKCLYGGDCKAEDVESIGHKMRSLFDTDLNDANEMGSFLIRLDQEVKDYQENNRRITSTAAASSTNVSFYERDGYSFARLMCSYNISENGTPTSQRLIFLLRREESTKRWKIYGWDLEENVDLNGDGIPGD